MKSVISGQSNHKKHHNTLEGLNSGHWLRPHWMKMEIMFKIWLFFCRWSSTGNGVTVWISSCRKITPGFCSLRLVQNLSGTTEPPGYSRRTASAQMCFCFTAENQRWAQPISGERPHQSGGGTAEVDICVCAFQAVGVDHKAHDLFLLRSTSLADTNALLRHQLSQSEQINQELAEDLKKLTADWTRAVQEAQQNEADCQKEKEVWGSLDINFDVQTRTNRTNRLCLWLWGCVYMCVFLCV